MAKKSKKNVTAPASNSFKSGFEKGLTDHCWEGWVARPARINRNRIDTTRKGQINADGLYYTIGKPTVRQYRKQHTPVLGWIHLQWPIKVLVAYTTKRRGVRWAMWIDGNELKTFTPALNLVPDSD